MSSAAVFDTMSRLVPDDAVIAVDVGNHAYSFGRYFECTRQTVLMSGYLGSIGFGFPAAMGAWAAAPERPILAVTGDGGFGQYLAELTTAVKYGMNITHVLLDNSSLGKISKEQRAGHFAVWQTSLHNPDFAEYARLCGAHGERVDDRGALDEAAHECPRRTTDPRSSTSSPTRNWSERPRLRGPPSWAKSGTHSGRGAIRPPSWRIVRESSRQSIPPGPGQLVWIGTTRSRTTARRRPR